MSNKEFVDAIASGDNVKAQNAFNTAISHKVGDSLELKRKEISKEFVKTQVGEDESF